MIFITGDTHRDYTRFKTDIFPEQKEMTKDDFVIICGDFGIWNNSKEENHWFDWLDNRPFTTLFVDGNHENFDLLNNYPVEQWHGGNVHFVRPSIVHLMRGQLFTIDGRTFFTMGGASSHDISDGILYPDSPGYKKEKSLLDSQGKFTYRISGISWWKEELPSEEEYDIARKTLSACEHSVDFILTHCAPNSISDTLGRGLYQPDALTNFLEEISQQCRFENWFFGHCHEDRIVNKRYVCLYEQIVRIPAKK